MNETSLNSSNWQPELEAFAELGYLVVRGQFSPELLIDMRGWIDSDLEYWKKYLNVNRPTESGSLAHHVLVQKHWRNYLNALEPQELFCLLLGTKPIINTFGINNNRSDGGLYHHRNHIDQKFTSDEELPNLINLLVFVDDFTEQNGATWIYPKNSNGFNTDIATIDNGLQVCGQAGDLLIWDSRMLHRAGSNLSGNNRRAVSIMLSRPWIKPQFDYLGGLSENEISSLSDIQKQLLGYRSRIPASLEDWYFPKIQRFTLTN